MKILWCDKNINQLIPLLEIINDEAPHYKILKCSDVPSALTTLFNNSDISLVISGQFFDKSSGLEFYNTIQSSISKYLPFILFTSYARDTLIDHYSLKNDFHYFSKLNFSLEGIMSLITNLSLKNYLKHQVRKELTLTDADIEDQNKYRPEKERADLIFWQRSRVAAGFTIEHVSEKLELPLLFGKHLILCFENGKIRPPKKYLKRLLELYCVDVEDYINLALENERIKLMQELEVKTTSPNC